MRNINSNPNILNMKKETLKQAEYKQPCCEIVDLAAETSYMLTSSSIEGGVYEEDEW